uniref:Snake venom vascular endothelial growth factor toxin barietin n=1 Tax=Bitis arietans TaxID=8692 RepID=TXVE_BITAR|nr:RecName: Full=Snake venom vascular endothelial growth factor toxin barietin; Short=svVEGF; AltName: Full=VEGF-F; Flags: Precursor [Bitis arietans]ACN22038.1 barietin precursor [Bitis arietans]
MAAYLLAVAILFCIQGWPSGTVQGEVRPFMEVYQRSVCQPRETLVSILEEYPDKISKIFRPSCVAVLRCGGCCSDESLTCTSVGERTVELQVMQVTPKTLSSKIKVMKFREHTACECRPRSGSRVNIGKHKRSPEEGEREPSSPLTPGSL